MSQGSLAYRKNKDAIWHFDVPKKYMRLVNLVPGRRVFELGAAEGVLALLLAERKEKVVALELRQERHEEALALQAHWREQGRDVGRCEMFMGDIRQRFDLLQGIDTFVGVRSIYYLRDDVDRVFEKIGQHAKNVLLCGNQSRARWYFEGSGDQENKLGKYNYYASREGMIEVLEKAGYRITSTVDVGDPIVIAAKDL